MQAKGTQSRSFLKQTLYATLLAALAAPMGAMAHIIDRADVERSGNEAVVTLRFDTQVQYQRHSPLSTGNALNLYFKIVGVDPDPISVIEESSLSKGDLFSGAKFRYPEPDQSLLVSFPTSTNFNVRQGADGRSISIYVPLKDAIAMSATESEARALLGKAQQSLKQGDAAQAIKDLNKLLGMPANASAQDAQELIGVAYEQNGENGKARSEFEYFLEAYPKSAAVARVKERLAKLAAVAPAAPVARPERVEEEAKWELTGGLGMTRYYGNSSTVLDPVVITVNNAGQEFQQLVNGQSIARTDQNALVTSLDLMARKRASATDQRIVMRDVSTMYFLKNPDGSAAKSDLNRLNALYYEQSNRDKGYLVRLGRQSANGGGVLSRFDGAAAGMDFKQMLRLNAVAGTNVEFGSIYKKNFFGANLDIKPSGSKWSGNTFAIQQNVNGLVDRQAVGFEARYFDPQKNFFTLVDYDTSFNALNIAMFQANFTSEKGATYYFSADYRRSPVLQLTSAQDVTGMSIETLVNTIGDKVARADIARITPMVSMLSTGMMYPYSEKWQFGGDFQISKMGATEASQNLPLTTQLTAQYPAQNDTGNTVVLSARAIGNSVLFKNDMNVISGSYIDASKITAPVTYKAQSLSFTNVARPNEKWQIDTSLRLYFQDKSDGEKLTRVNPVLRGLYYWKKNVSFEAEINAENENITGGSAPSSANRRYYYAGYRWDI